MNKYIVAVLFCVTCLLAGCISTGRLKKYRENMSGSAIASQAWRPTPRMEEDTATSAAITGSGVNSANNVTEEMQGMQYWIGKTLFPDKVVLAEEDIRELNEKMMQQLSTEGEARYYNLNIYNDSLDGVMLKKMMERTEFSGKTCYRDKEPVTENDWDAYLRNCNKDALADLNKVRYGIVCSRADVRKLPTSDVLSEKPGNALTDFLQDTALPVNEPVLIAHQSRDGKWYYILSTEYSGWVEENRIGICQSREEWLKAQERKDFLVVTGDKVYLEPNPVNPYTDRLELTMGTCVPLAPEEEYRGRVDGRKVYDNYVVKIPVRQKDGLLSWELAMVPLGKEVHRGYLEYTRANVLRLSFSLLGNYYGWGGSFDSRDCSSMVKDIYACFGLRLPRDSGVMARILSEGRMDISGLSVDEKRQRLYSLEAGAVLQMPGHVMIYLGCVDQHYYVISANGQFADVGTESGEEDYSTKTVTSAGAGLGLDAAGEEDYSTKTVTVNDLEVKSPSDGKTWLEQLSAIVLP